eukprot:GHVT01092786.1.p2 GENE.GHVT01092786.1~~GHVT01092786.1.p2  ORF type:complete len:131 (+),score=20.68 GHVT01092786.1:559-951(+)
MLSAVATSCLRHATVVLSVSLMFTMLAGGFFVNTNSMPPGLKGVKWLSYHSYACSALIQTTLLGRTIACAQAGTSQFPSCPEFPITGSEVAYSIAAPMPFWACWLVLASVFVVLKFITYLYFRFSKKLKM